MVAIGLDNNPSNRFVIYSKDGCPYCEKAQDLLSDLGIPFTLYKLGVHYTKETLLEKVKLGFNERLTVPQVFYNGVRIGGYDKLCEYMNDHQGGFGDGQL